MAVGGAVRRDRFPLADEAAPVTTDPFPPLPTRGPVAPWRGLSFKQAVATLVIALGLGAIGGAWDLVSDYRRLRAEVADGTAANLALVRGLAAEAAYLLNADLAREVVAGLAHDPLAAEIRLTDNFGGVLAEVTRPADRVTLPDLAERLFGDLSPAPLGLHAAGAAGAEVGRLDLRLDPGRLFNRYLDHVVANTVAGIANTVVLCLLVVTVFYILITKPLLRIIAALSRVDPARPGAAPIPLPPRHRDDELGRLVTTANDLLAASQRDLDGRDAAEAELAALARDLERRVTERTAELEREKQGVELANAQLEKANRFISDGIRYASRIQTALLPDSAALEGLVEEIVIGWRPFDIVGGDYYWIGRFGDKAVIAVMDCTGHGVPGAFMTAVVSSILARILHHHGHDDPATILGLLDVLVRTALRQDRGDGPADDGLDAAICVLDPDRRRLSFAGANLPLTLWENGEIRSVRGDRRSLGYRESRPLPSFTTHEIELQPDSVFYLYTDGVTDQIGGPHRLLFGRHRLQQALARCATLPLERQKDELLATLDQWRGDQPRRDDMTFVAFRPRRDDFLAEA
ncbi:MAG: hypothetical protein RLZZ501_1286 [Pseudomonadota bacterium]